MSSDPYHDNSEKSSGSDNKDTHSFAKYAAVTVLVIGVWFSEAFLFLLLWGWFIVPLGVPNITYAHAFGIYLLWSFIKIPTYNKKRSEEPSDLDY